MNTEMKTQAVVVKALPAAYLRKYVELAGRKPGFVEGLITDGILPAEAPAPAK